jgi:hypothetical protein
MVPYFNTRTCSDGSFELRINWEKVKPSGTITPTYSLYVSGYCYSEFDCGNEDYYELFVGPSLLQIKFTQKFCLEKNWPAALSIKNEKYSLSQFDKLDTMLGLPLNESSSLFRQEFRLSELMSLKFNV